MRTYARKTLVDETALMLKGYRNAALSTLEGLVKECEAAGNSAAAASLVELRYEIEPLRDEDVLK
jgi:hypothetical protein